MLEYSIIVPHYNDLPGLEACLESLLHQTIPRSAYEVIIVDNNSTDDVDGLVRRFGAGFVLKRELKQGAAHARNRGLASAKGAKILFTDSDCTVAPDWIERLGASLDHAALCGGRIIVTATAPDTRSAVEWFETVFAFDQERYVAVMKFSATANLGLRAEIADVVGGFTEGVSEDVDWCWRALERGVQLSYDPDAVVYHPARRTVDELFAKWRRITDQDLALRRTRGATRSYLLARQMIVALSPFVHMSRVLAMPGIPIRARFGAVVILFRIRAYRMVYGIQRLITGPDDSHARTAC